MVFSHLFLSLGEKTSDMLRIETLVFNSFQVNTYVVWDENGECLVVDPAFQTPEESEQFDRLIKEKEWSINGQIHTHCHVDHLLGVPHMKNRYGHPFRAHPDEGKNIERAPLMGEIFGLNLDPLEGIDQEIHDGDRISVGSSFLEAILVPGHSPGSLAFHAAEPGFVITGDALFQGSIGRTDLPGGDYDQLIHSIRSRLLIIPSDTTVYPGHGPSSTIGAEQQDNPFLTMVP